MKYLAPKLSLLATVIFASVTGALLVGCKGDPAPAGRPEAEAPRPVLRVPGTAQALLMADPFVDPVWQKAHWLTLTPALRDTRTPPLTRVASYYGPKCLYVAFLCAAPNTNPQLREAGGAPIASTPIDPKMLLQDQVEIWLDTSAAQNGTEMLAVTVNAQGKVLTDWYRASTAPEPKEDGTPNHLYPVNQLPNYVVPGLKAQGSVGKLDGQAAWGTVVEIPFQGLPIPMRVEAAQIKPGSHWRINLLRADVIKKAGQGQDILQANLSPIYTGSQPLAPYRMTQLVLEGPNPTAPGSAVVLTGVPPTSGN